MDKHVIDFPKIKSPFIRTKVKGRSIVTPEIEPGYEWVFEDSGVLAVDKLHGTNICCIFEDGKLLSIDNRNTRVIDSPEITCNENKVVSKFVLGVLNSITRGFIPKHYSGRLYGELVGPTFNNNIHLLNSYYFVPFDYLKDSCHWVSWVTNKYPKTFESISECFKTLPSLFTKRMARVDSFAEGLVFHHPKGRMAKLRRDMFDWYKEND